MGGTVNILLAFAIAVGVAMDASAVAMANGMAERRVRPRKALYIALVFGLFQGAMPVCGYYFGRIFSGLVRDIAEYISFLLLFLLGGRMLYEAITAPEAGLMLMERETILLQGVATSIDALLVGVALTLSGAGIIRAALVIAAVTTVLSFASVYVGCACGRVLEDKARALGGIILLMLAARILARGFR